jgi:hypothetical protein
MTDLETVGSTSNLSARLREVETEHGAPDDLLVVRTQVVVAFANHEETEERAKESRYRLGEALNRFRVALPYGTWMAAVKAITEDRKRSDRAIREIVADYLRVKGVAPEVIVELELHDIDPASKKHKKLVALADQGYTAGQPVQQAVETARATVRRLVRPRVPMTQDEQWVMALCVHILKGLDKVPEHRIVDIFGIAGAFAIGHKTSSRDPITIIPIEPVVAPSGRKKPPKEAALDDEQTEPQDQAG